MVAVRARPGVVERALRNDGRGGFGRVERAGEGGSREEDYVEFHGELAARSVKNSLQSAANCRWEAICGSGRCLIPLSTRGPFEGGRPKLYIIRIGSSLPRDAY